MEFYLSPSATDYFNMPIQHAVGIVKEKMTKGFFPWLLNPFKRKYDVEVQLDLPVFFVCAKDLGKSLRLPEWHVCREDKYQPASDITGTERSVALSLPEYVEIPDEGSFAYERNGHLIDTQIIKAENEKVQPGQLLESRKGSFDWLGSYYGFMASYRCIFVRIDEIMLEEPRLAHPWGVASVILHELAHALMDTLEKPDLRFMVPVRKELAHSLDYYVEEAMANLIAYRSIRGRDVPCAGIENISVFMESQPFPYALGVKMGKAHRTRNSSLDFIIKSYILKWYNAKKCEATGIGDCRKWYEMIYDGKPFTDTDIKEQYETLFVKL